MTSPSLPPPHRPHRGVPAGTSAPPPPPPPPTAPRRARRYLCSFAFTNHSMAQNVLMIVNFLTGFVLVLAAQGVPLPPSLCVDGWEGVQTLRFPPYGKQGRGRRYPRRGNPPPSSHSSHLAGPGGLGNSVILNWTHPTVLFGLNPSFSRIRFQNKNTQL